jgi:putative salt-induced outer membrane protein YdiY
MRTGLCTIVMLCVIFRAGFADEIVFTNGECLIGTLKHAKGHKLIFVSEVAGEITVDLGRVQRIATDAPMAIHLTEGAVLKCNALESKGERFTVIDAAKAQAGDVPFVSLSAINPKPEPNVQWSGSITAGFKSSHGGSFSENYSVDGNLGMRTARHRLRLGGRFVAERDKDDSGDKNTTEENATLDGIYSYYFSRRFFVYLNERFKKDHIDDLDYRITSVPGVGYQWVDTDTVQLSTQAGVGLLQEKYTSKDPAPDDETVEVKKIARKEDFIMQMGYHAEWKINDRFSFVSNLAYNPSPDDFSDYNLTHDSEVRAFITKSLFSSFKFILDYDSKPGEDSASTDTDYIVGFGWRF